MRYLPLLLALPIATFAAAAESPKPLFSENFEDDAPGKLPAEFKVYAGAFAVQQDGAAKFLELPGAPLDTFGILFGPVTPAPVGASARIFGTKTGRKFPAFGLSVAGAGGFRLQVSAAKGALELIKGDVPQASIPFIWASGSWTALRVQVRPKGAGCVVEGKAWPADSPEPKEWQITFESPAAAPTGQSGVWGNPFSGTPIRYDDLVVVSAAESL